ncbi:MAG TPA: hypothetical protein VKP30_07725 [Polyangiaceae bacterium]|nr:hypothetical protein [Polyangiaceae bacterium]
MSIKRRYLCAARLAFAAMAYGLPGNSQDPGVAPGVSGVAPAVARVCFVWNVVGPDPECPTAAELETSAERILGRSEFATKDCNVYVTGTMQRSSEGRWIAELSFETKGGETLGTRRLENPSVVCSAMRGPLSFVLALMIESTRTPNPTIVTQPNREPRPKRADTLRPKITRRSVGFVDARGSFDLLPGITPGASLGVALPLFRTLPSRIEGTIWVPKSTDHVGPGGNFWGWHAGFALCPTLSTSDTLSMMFCGGAQLGLLHGRGFGLDYTQSSRRAYGHTEARLTVEIPMQSSIAFSAQLGLAVPFVRPPFGYLDQANSELVLYRPNAIVPIAGVGLVWRE